MKKCRQYAAFIRFSPFFVVQLRLWICLRSILSKQIVHNHLPGKAKRVYPRNSTNWISSAVHTLKKKGICWTPNVLQSNWQAGLQCLSISYFDIIYDLFGIRKSFAQRLEQETDALSCVDVWRIISNVSQTVERTLTTRTTEIDDQEQMLKRIHKYPQALLPGDCWGISPEPPLQSLHPSRWELLQWCQLQTERNLKLVDNYIDATSH